MDKQHDILNTLVSVKMLPLFFHPSPEVSAGVLRALYEGGVRAVEYTNRGPEALANFGKLRKICQSELPGLFLGIGTIRNAAAARDFIDAGADFLISPGISAPVFEETTRQGLLYLPGCMTPSEIMLAESLGAKMVKLFPGNMLGPGFVSAIKDLFPGMLFMPTGGVDMSRQNLRDWFAAGVSAVGMGSKLLSAAVMESRDYPRITSMTKEVLQTIAEVQGA